MWTELRPSYVNIRLDGEDEGTMWQLIDVYVWQKNAKCHLCQGGCRSGLTGGSQDPVGESLRGFEPHTTQNLLQHFDFDQPQQSDILFFVDDDNLKTEHIQKRRGVQNCHTEPTKDGLCNVSVATSSPSSCCRCQTHLHTVRIVMFNFCADELCYRDDWHTGRLISDHAEVVLGWLRPPSMPPDQIHLVIAIYSRSRAEMANPRYVDDQERHGDWAEALLVYCSDNL